MRIVVMEPLGLPENRLRYIAAELTDKGHELIVFNNRAEEEKELINRVSGAEIIVLANQPLRSEVIKADNDLKMISVAFTGVDHIDMDECRKRGITVCNAAGYSTPAVAELAFGLIISVLRNIVPLDRAVRDGGTKAGYCQSEVFGKTVGVIGTGAIGMRTANIARAFGCNVIAYSRTKKREAENAGVEYVSLNELLSRSDIISVHVPLNSDTKGLISRDKIALMKKSAILINTSRGAVVDNNALAEALKNGAIAGAGIDVFETEPPINEHPLFNAPNTVLTPHIGFATSEALERRAEITFDNIVKWLEGNPRNIVK
jgi:Lactate dehydrogenase and related dehydrogenases